MTWHPVTQTSPRPEDLPCTVVRSRQRNRAFWTDYHEGDTTPPDVRSSVAPFFDPDELVCCEDWFPPVA